jgi:hypothetical protein
MIKNFREKVCEKKLIVLRASLSEHTYWLITPREVRYSERMPHE